MRCFYERFNAALAGKLALEEALAAARRDRAALQAALDTCSALSALRPDALDAPNMLLVVNGRTGLPPRAPPPAPAHGGRA